MARMSVARLLIVGVAVVALSASARTIYVSPSGNDTTGNGGNNTPYLTIMKAVGTAQSGDTIFVRNGAYHDAIVIPGALSGTAENPTVMRGESRDATIVDGEFTRGCLFTTAPGGAEYFHLENMTFRNSRFGVWNRAAISVQSESDWGNEAMRLRGWVVKDLIVEKSEGIGLAMSCTRDAVVQNCILQDNFQFGISSCNFNNLRVTGTTLARNDAGWSYNPWAAGMIQYNDPNLVILDTENNKWFINQEFGCGGNKDNQYDSVTYENCDIYGNCGPGLWGDTQCRNFFVRNCSFHDQFNCHQRGVFDGGIGIMFENNVEGGMLIEGCTFYNNTNEDINICESPNITIRNNVVSEFNDLENGSRITFRDGFDPRPAIANVLIENNIFQNTLIERRRGVEGGWTPELLAERNIVFRNNQWQGTEPRTLEWECAPEWYVTVEHHGLDEMRAGWGTFFTDTYRTEITTEARNFVPAYGMPQTRILPRQSAILCDMRGRRVLRASAAGRRNLFSIVTDGTRMLLRGFWEHGDR